jgi:predicted transcriptional regulator of viral defense system
MDIYNYVEKLTASGHYCFTREDMEKALGCSSEAAKMASLRMRKKRVLAMPIRGFFVIVPPEYRSIGCLPAIQFIPRLMEHLEICYYIGLLSAAELHGSAHQRPQEFQVIVAVNRPGITCGKVRVRFVARRNVSDIPTVGKKTSRGYAIVSTLESTAIDLVGYPRYTGGISNVTTILAELSKHLDADGLVEVAHKSPLPWAQRLGYLLEFTGGERATEPLARYVKRKAREYIPLRPSISTIESVRNRRWKLIVNEHIETDL